MPTELNIGANLETPKVEIEEGVLKKRPDLKLEKQETERKTVNEIVGEAAVKVMAAQLTKSIISDYEEREKQIEDFLSDGLDDIYLSLSPEKQAEFRQVGEETAKKINKLLESAKINIGKIISLIRKWLLIIPGVNKYFLEQEVKIKSDEIMKLKKIDK
jgi:hypothetical protein